MVGTEQRDGSVNFSYPSGTTLFNEIHVSGQNFVWTNPNTRAMSKLNDLKSLVLSGPLESAAVVRTSADNTGCDCARPSTFWASSIRASWQCALVEEVEESAGYCFPQFG